MLLPSAVRVDGWPPRPWSQVSDGRSCTGRVVIPATVRVRPAPRRVDVGQVQEQDEPGGAFDQGPTALSEVWRAR